MDDTIRKRSVVVAGHRTSVSLESAFWTELKAIAAERRQSINELVESVDKGRAGMASTFLVRMKVGPILVDAKGVNRLYDNRVRKRDLIPLLVAAIITRAIISAVSDPIRTVVRGLLLSVR